MTVYEMAEITSSEMGNFLATFSVFLTVASAYIVAAYLVGKKLTSLQFAIVNGCYLIAATILGFLVSANFRVFYIWASSNTEGPVAQSEIAPILVDFTWALSFLLILIVLGSLAFMYSVRKGKAVDQDT